jgi:molecular chaperone GrpE (heat shock protein)
MNKHFEDARYYLGRATEHAKEGLKEELEPLEDRFRELTGREEEPEPSRLERVQADLKALEGRAEGETKKAIHSARERISTYRSDEQPVEERSAE